MPSCSPVLTTTTLIAAAVLLVAGCKGHGKPGSVAASTSARVDTTVGHAPADVRIKVEILNASRIHGAARSATLLLRQRGYDVVASGNAGQLQDATVVLDRSNHPEWAELIAKAIGGKALSKPDTSRYLDATVILGASWTAPPMPFHP
ncbi:MAG: LytR C-terminal domain-containing protein [Gemmatimonadaceae bacterium]